MQVVARGILLDVEGTTSAIAYVYDVMFPYARKHLAEYIAEHFDDESMQDVRQRIASEASVPLAKDSPTELTAAAEQLMDGDVKATGLKLLQGLVWEAGFRSGQLVAHVFDDVAPCLKNWESAGVGLRIYSSGSVHAQRLFFGHSSAGNLLPFFSGHYDTTTGPKKEVQSYRQIADDWQLPAADVLFLSDVPQELSAASEAGMQVALVVRPGNKPVGDDCIAPRIESFEDLTITPRETE